MSKSKKLFRFSAFLLPFMFLMTFNSFGQRAERFNGKEFYIQAKHSAKNLDWLKTGATGNVLQKNPSAPGQIFKLDKVGGEYWTITHVSTGMLLTNVVNQNNAGLRSAANQKNQKWQLISKGNGFFFLKSKENNKHVEVEGKLKTNKANVVMANASGNSNQLFKFIAVSKSNPTSPSVGKPDPNLPSNITSSTFYLVAKHSGKVLDIFNESVGNKANVQQYEKHNKANQQFKFESAGGKYHFIKNVGSGKYLEVANGKAVAGTNVWQYKKNATDAQKWYLKQADHGYYYIVSKLDNKLILNIKGAKTTDGANLIIWNAGKSDNSMFELIDKNSVLVRVKNSDIEAYEVYVINQDGDEIATVRYGEVKEIRIKKGSYINFKRKLSPTGTKVDVNYKGAGVIITEDQLPCVVFAPVNYTNNIKDHPAIDDNLYGYDLRDMSPIDITTGKKGIAIFNDFLSTFNTNSSDGYRIHKQFEHDASVHMGSEVYKSKSYASSEDMAKGFSLGGNIGVSDPVSGASVNVSGNFSKIDTYANSTNSVFSSFDKKQSLFAIKLIDGTGSIEETPDLSIGLIIDIKELPIINENITSSNQAKQHQQFQKYQEFVNKWGTHYAKRIVYGGRNITIFESSFESSSEQHESNYGAGVDASVPLPTTPPINVETGFEVAGMSSTSSAIAQGATTKHESWMGGDKSDGTWNLDKTNAEPIEIELKAISELLKPNYFLIDGLSDAELAKKRKMLAFVIKYLVPDPNAWKYKAPKVRYTFQARMWKLKDNSGGGKIYGKIYTGLENGYNDLPFDRSRNNHFRPGENVPQDLMNQPYVYIYDPNAANNIDHFYVNAQLRERDDAANKDNKNGKDDVHDKNFKFFFNSFQFSNRVNEYVKWGPFEIEYFAQETKMVFEDYRNQ